METMSVYIRERAEHLLQRKIQYDLGVADKETLIYGMAENADSFFSDIVGGRELMSRRQLLSLSDRGATNWSRNAFSSASSLTLLLLARCPQ